MYTFWQKRACCVEIATETFKTASVALFLKHLQKQFKVV